MHTLEASRRILHSGPERDTRERIEAKLADAEARVDAPTAEEREKMIAIAAYYRARARGFEPGHEFDDWLAAEAQVDEQLGLRVTPRASVL